MYNEPSVESPASFFQMNPVLPASCETHELSKRLEPASAPAGARTTRTESDLNHAAMR